MPRLEEEQAGIGGGGGDSGKRMCARQVMRYKKFKKLPPVAAKRQFLLHKSKYFQLPLPARALFFVVVCTVERTTDARTVRQLEQAVK